MQKFRIAFATILLALAGGLMFAQRAKATTNLTSSCTVMSSGSAGASGVPVG